MTRGELTYVSLKKKTGARHRMCVRVYFALLVAREPSDTVIAFGICSLFSFCFGTRLSSHCMHDLDRRGGRMRDGDLFQLMDEVSTDQGSEGGESTLVVSTNSSTSSSSSIR